MNPNGRSWRDDCRPAPGGPPLGSTRRSITPTRTRGRRVAPINDQNYNAEQLETLRFKLQGIPEDQYPRKHAGRHVAA